MASYNKEYYCTYPFIFLLLREDGDNSTYTKEEEDMIQQISYKNDLLNIFFLSDNESEANINACIQTYFDTIDPTILECSKTLASKFSCNDARFGFSLLFTYDYLHYTHTCMCELLTHGKITESSLQNLQKLIYNGWVD